MKRNNKLMRASGFLLVLTLITSCFVGGTFAKYVSQTSGFDSARVAKWGVTLEQVTDVEGSWGDSGFSTTYETDEEPVVNDYQGEAIAISVDGDTEDVVAPGTSGVWDGIAFKMIDTEVAVQLTTDATITLTGWEVDGKFYCPLIFTVGPDDDDVINGLDYENAENLQNDLIKKIEENGTHAHKPGTYNPSYGNGTNYGAGYFSWEWPFENSTGSSNPDSKQDDTKDTALGELATATISFDMDIIATQID